MSIISFIHFYNSIIVSTRHRVMVRIKNKPNFAYNEKPWQPTKVKVIHTGTLLSFSIHALVCMLYGLYLGYRLAIGCKQDEYCEYFVSHGLNARTHARTHAHTHTYHVFLSLCFGLKLCVCVAQKLRWFVCKINSSKESLVMIK